MPGATSVVRHHIDTGNAHPVHQKPYRVPQSRQQAIQEELKRMLHLGIMQPSSSPWCSPVVVVAKLDETIRFCLNFQGLNRVSKFDAYPLSQIDELLEQKQRVTIKALKTALTTTTILSSADSAKELVVQTDTSNTLTGAVLTQRNGEEHPIAYICRKLSPVKQYYSTEEREALALKLGVENLQYQVPARIPEEGLRRERNDQSVPKLQG
ncbi:hypothetical protein QYM36_008256 [Artemia franciscana]|uniref:Reverse transcriptase/retrotransposon-derived protein RNase H-like domain-containing protein n=1 Tax=Artemia franciscana TaxID=6661 RepID=A0AA88IIS1_ARTSF|nr:hypothetical protein QYM36_008256 [Artemia franciscana]